MKYIHYWLTIIATVYVHTIITHYIATYCSYMHLAQVSVCVRVRVRVCVRVCVCVRMCVCVSM